ncbi:MAG: hypothetical protein ACWA6R_07790 [Nitrosomonas sp.]
MSWEKRAFVLQWAEIERKCHLDYRIKFAGSSNRAEQCSGTRQGDYEKCLRAAISKGVSSIAAVFNQNQTLNRKKVNDAAGGNELAHCH